MVNVEATKNLNIPPKHKAKIHFMFCAAKGKGNIFTVYTSFSIN